VKQGSYRIAILTDYMLHPTDDRFLVVEENLGLLNLIRFILGELLWDVDVFQASPIARRVLDGVNVFGIDAKADQVSMFPGLNSAFAQRSLEYDLRIYFHWHVAAPKVCHRSIVVSHGIFWDAPSTRFNRLHSVDKCEWERRLLYGVTAPEAFIAEDRNTINVIKAMWPGYEHRLVYIPPGINLLAFSRQEPKDESEVIQIICPQDFLMEQGINEVLAVACMAWERGANMEFHIVGHMRDEKEASIMADHISSLPNCKFYSGNWDNPADLYTKFDFALMPFRATEGASLYCLQAMACGLPVIAGFAGGLAEFVVDGWNGYLVNPEAANLIQAVLELASDRSLRLRMGENARRLAEGYPESLWKQRWSSLLNRILAKNQEGGD
jgi:glycosyltransferase involved in cell wall biosynthesis